MFDPGTHEEGGPGTWEGPTLTPREASGHTEARISVSDKGASADTRVSWPRISVRLDGVGQAQGEPEPWPKEEGLGGPRWSDDGG